MQQAPRAAALYSSVASLGIKPSDVTSVVSGPHVAHSAHFDGRAIDVGAIAGAAVAYNRATWDFLVRAIAQGSLKRIGTLAAFVNDPRLRSWAAAHGVDLFVDDASTGATGPHMHLEAAAQ